LDHRKEQIVLLDALKLYYGSANTNYIGRIVQNYYPDVKKERDWDRVVKVVDQVLEELEEHADAYYAKAQEMRSGLETNSDVEVYYYLCKRLVLIKRSLEKDHIKAKDWRFGQKRNLRVLNFALHFAGEAHKKLKAARVLYTTKLTSFKVTLDSKDIWRAMLKGPPGVEILEKAILLLRPRARSPTAKAVERWNNRKPTKPSEVPLLMDALKADETVYAEYPEIRETIIELGG
jgi:hypothetical protein